MEKPKITIDEMAAFCKRKGFVYPSGEIYGGLAGFWDFGPLGVEVVNNLKRSWWAFHVHSRDDVVGIDGSIISNPKVWEASGHVGHFVDYLVRNKKTGELFKVDAHEVEKYKKDYLVVDDVKNAVAKAIEFSEDNDFVCITGSVFTVGEARDIWYPEKVVWGRELNEIRLK